MIGELDEVKRIVLVLGYTDMRKGRYGLAAEVQYRCGMNPVELGTLWVFCGRRKKHLKMLLYQPGGFLLLDQEVMDGVYQWPKIEADTLELSKEDFKRFLEGYTVVPSIRIPDISKYQAGGPYNGISSNQKPN